MGPGVGEQRRWSRLGSTAALLVFVGRVAFAGFAFALGAELEGIATKADLRFQPWPGPGPAFGWAVLYVSAVVAGVAAIVSFVRWARVRREHAQASPANEGVQDGSRAVSTFARIVLWTVYLVGSAGAALLVLLASVGLLLGMFPGQRLPDG